MDISNILENEKIIDVLLGYGVLGVIGICFIIISLVSIKKQSSTQKITLKNVLDRLNADEKLLQENVKTIERILIEHNIQTLTLLETHDSKAGTIQDQIGTVSMTTQELRVTLDRCNAMISEVSDIVARLDVSIKDVKQLAFYLTKERGVIDNIKLPMKKDE